MKKLIFNLMILALLVMSFSLTKGPTAWAGGLSDAGISNFSDEDPNTDPNAPIAENWGLISLADEDPNSGDSNDVEIAE